MIRFQVGFEDRIVSSSWEWTRTVVVFRVPAPLVLIWIPREQRFSTNLTSTDPEDWIVGYEDKFSAIYDFT